MTAVQPAARAAPSFRVIMAEGKFQGVRIELEKADVSHRCFLEEINTDTTPIGCLMTTLRVVGKGHGMTSVW